VPAFEDVRAAALGADAFSSAQGVALLPPFNEPMLGGVLASDGDAHDRLRVRARVSRRALRARRVLCPPH
jgi:cytochrome P450